MTATIRSTASVADKNSESGTIQVDRIVTGLDNSLFGATPQGRPNIMFVPEQHTGAIQIVNLNTNTVLPTPFLDIPDSELSAGGEQGLLGLAFDPNYAANGKFYIDITNAAGDTEIWQYKRSDGNPNVADPASKKLIIRIDQPFANHNGGWIAFGPTVISTSRWATAARAAIRSATHRTSIRCSASSCASMCTATISLETTKRITPFRTTIRSSAIPAPTKYGPTGYAIPTATASIPRRAISTSPMWGRMLTKRSITSPPARRSD